MQSHRQEAYRHLNIHMATFEILLALVAFCVLLALLAQRLTLPVTVPLVLGGMVLAFVPGLLVVELNPELALALFLPPLLPVNPCPQRSSSTASLFDLQLSDATLFGQTPLLRQNLPNGQ